MLEMADGVTKSSFSSLTGLLLEPNLAPPQPHPPRHAILTLLLPLLRPPRLPKQVPPLHQLLSSKSTTLTFRVMLGDT